MAVSQSTQYAAQVAAKANYADAIDDGRQLSGAVQYAECDVTWDGDESASETVTLVELPEHAQVLPELSKIIVSTDCAATLTVDVGDADDADRYCDGADCAAVGVIEFTSAAIPAGVTTRHDTTASDASGDDTRKIIATWATLATPAAGQIKFLIAYKTN